MSTRYNDWDDDPEYGRDRRDYDQDRARYTNRGSEPARDRSFDRADEERRRYWNRDAESDRDRQYGGMYSRDYGGYGTGYGGSRAGYPGGYDYYGTNEPSYRSANRYGRSEPVSGRDVGGAYDRDYGGRSYYGREDRSSGSRDRRESNRRGFLDRASDEVASWFGDEEAERRRQMDAARNRGSYAGRGPKGYKRSDDRIREDVNDRLTDHAYLDATEIEVAVNDGIVTLSGTAESRYAKRLAEDLAESVAGVKDVDNNIRVDRGAAVPGRASANSNVTGSTPSTTH